MKRGKELCEYCGEAIGPNALYCAKCMVPIFPPVPRRRPGTLSLFLGVSLLFGSPCVWVIGKQVVRHLDRVRLARAQAASKRAAAVDEAQALIRGCGTPTRDISTANNDPRPPIPFRLLDYSSQHLEFAFVPGDGAKIGDPPPYVWMLSGILDTTTKGRMTPAEAGGRMGCARPALGAAGAADATASPGTSQDTSNR